MYKLARIPMLIKKNCRRQQEIICYEHINSNAKPFFMLNSFCIEREREREEEEEGMRVWPN
jgi:hypothetical protein